jgi:DNA-binding response OmpR family regulator
MRLLLVEDERDLSSAIKRVLEYNKFDVDVAYDGIQGLQKIDENEYDGVILDVMMPRMDGFQMVRRLRDNGNNIPVLMLTARGEIDDKVLGLDSGADDYLTKPFQIKELLARIRALLRRKGEVKEAYSYEDINLDTETFELVCNSKRIRLTNKEYKLMECLIRNHNNLLSTEKLMENVWDYDTEAEINVVWAYISALRKKLEKIGSKLTVKAVRGIGYQLGDKNG